MSVLGWPRRRAIQAGLVAAIVALMITTIVLMAVVTSDSSPHTRLRRSGTTQPAPGTTAPDTTTVPDTAAPDTTTHDSAATQPMPDVKPPVEQAPTTVVDGAKSSTTPPPEQKPPAVDAIPPAATALPTVLPTMSQPPKTTTSTHMTYPVSMGSITVPRHSASPAGDAGSVWNTSRRIKALTTPALGSPFMSEAERLQADWPLLYQLEAALRNGRLKGTSTWRADDNDHEEAGANTMPALLNDFAADPVVSKVWERVGGLLHADPVTPPEVEPVLDSNFLSTLLDDVSVEAHIQDAPILAVGCSPFHVGMHIASKLPRNPVLFLSIDAAGDRLPPKHACDSLHMSDVHSMLKRGLDLPNVLVAHASDANTVSKAAARHHKPIGMLMLDDLRYVAGTMIPHEFESWLGRMLNSTTYALLPASLPTTRYFSYWQSSKQLVQQAAASLELIVRVRSVGTGQNDVFGHLLVQVLRKPAQAALQALAKQVKTLEDSSIKAFKELPAPKDPKAPDAPSMDQYVTKALRAAKLVRSVVPTPAISKGFNLTCLLSMTPAASMVEDLFSMLLTTPIESHSAATLLWTGRGLVDAFPVKDKRDDSDSAASGEADSDSDHPKTFEDGAKLRLKPSTAAPAEPVATGPTRNAPAAGTTRHLLGLPLEDSVLTRVANALTMGAGGARSSNDRLVDWSSLSSSRQQRLVSQEAAAFDAWWPVLHTEIEQSVKPSSSWHSLLFGSGLSLMGVKAAAAFPDATVVNVLPHVGSFEAHNALVSLMRVQNNLVCVSQLTADRVTALQAGADMARFQILGQDLMMGVLEQSAKLEAFEEFLGQVLSLADTSFVELPDWSALLRTLRILGSTAAPATSSTVLTDEPISEKQDDIKPVLVSAKSSQHGSAADATWDTSHVASRYNPAGSGDPKWAPATTTPVPQSDTHAVHPYKALIGRALRKMGAKDASIRLLTTSTSTRSLYIRVDLQPWARRGSTQVAPRGLQTLEGISLHSLLTLGVTDRFRADLFNQFLQLNNLLPSQLAGVSGSTTLLSPASMRYIQSRDSGFGVLMYSAIVDGVTKTIRSDDEVRRAAAAVDPTMPGVPEEYTDPRWELLQKELVPEDTRSGLQPGTFSFIEYNSGIGGLSLNVAKAFPDATVLSVESSKEFADAHYAAVLRQNITNNQVCSSNVDSRLLTSMYQSPEFLRYQVFSGRFPDILRQFSIAELREMYGRLFGCGATTFTQMPSSRLLSMAFTIFLDVYPDSLELPCRKHAGVSEVDFPSVSDTRFDLQYHPRPGFVASELRLLSALTVSPATTSVAVTTLGGVLGDDQPLLRVDLTELERHVNHHFQSEIDGHDRKYTLHVSINETETANLAQRRAAAVMEGLTVLPLPLGNHPVKGSVLSVQLVRDKDTHHIPYVSVYGVTLITLLRLGLLSPLRARAYHLFVNLPLYEDMAPWNIVFLGRRLDYIDYDTKDKTFDKFVPKAYQTMEVLFNYKRTVEDFSKCGGKAGNPYNFPFVSDCVLSDFKGPCNDPAFPVPCGDRTCRSDYVSCLRAMSAKELVDRFGPHRTVGDLLPRPQDTAAAGPAPFTQYQTGQWKFGSQGVVPPKA